MTMISTVFSEAGLIVSTVVNEPDLLVEADVIDALVFSQTTSDVINGFVFSQTHVQPSSGQSTPENHFPSSTNFDFSPEYTSALKQQRDQQILAQFNGDYKITDNFVRINGGSVTFWLHGSETREGRITLTQFENKLTVILTADFNPDYIFYWTDGGEDFLEWTHYQDFGSKNPVRWTKIGFNTQWKETPRRYLDVINRNRNNSYSSMDSSVTSERLDISETHFSMSRRSSNCPSRNIVGYPTVISPSCQEPSLKTSKSSKKNVAIAQDHNAKQRMLCKTGFECIDRWADIVIDKERALNLRKTTIEQRECLEVKSILHNICDDIPGLRGPFVFGIRAKKLGELENTILFLEDMENISTFKRMSLIFNSKRKRVDGISVKKRQKKTICIYVEVENVSQIQGVLKRYEEKWSHLISYCQIRDDQD